MFFPSALLLLTALKHAETHGNSHTKHKHTCTHMHTHTYTRTHTDSLFESSCLLTDDSSGMEIANIPPTATAQSGSTSSLYNSSSLIPFINLFLCCYASTPSVFLCRPTQSSISSFVTWRTLNSNICPRPHKVIKLPKGKYSIYKGVCVFITMM